MYTRYKDEITDISNINRERGTEMQSLDFVDKEFENNYLMYAEISVGKT